MRLSEHTFRTISRLSGPLLFVRNVFNARIGETVTVAAPDGRKTRGEVLEIKGSSVLIGIYGETQGLDIGGTTVVFTDSLQLASLSPGMIGRIFNGSFDPIDGMPMYIPEKRAQIDGSPMNPSARARPEDFIETGISVIDGLNSVVKGQKLPVFSCSGLPSRELVASVLKNARLVGGSKASADSSVRAEDDSFVVVFAALGVSFHDYDFYMQVIREMKTGFVAFVNMADEPVMERLLAPRLALTAAEYLAFDRGADVLVIITDMTNYCDALREASSAREELPGRRGYPGYMYSDLASLYERAGRVKGIRGSVTLLPVLTMPEDDITHPIPDLTGYITEGQIVLSRELHQKGIFPPVDVLPSLSRLMQRGIGDRHTRSDHREISNLLYKHYAGGRDMRRLEAIVGREGIPEHDRSLLDFAETFEREFVHQGEQRRNILETLDAGLGLLKRFSLHR
jgi:V/A-type H+-transporting ATPase subunit B